MLRRGRPTGGSAPTSGPVTTDDVADALSHVVVALVGAGTNIATSFRNLSTIGGATTWDPNPYSEQFTAAHQRSTRTTRSMPERGRHYRR
ncbi:MAG: hypothetical protein O2815_11650 [Actinomycetota bacterium]|nr:hypothetical protein [Actinomycetota bacterium]